jgi:hypothetical protein
MLYFNKWLEANAIPIQEASAVAETRWDLNAQQQQAFK